MQIFKNSIVTFMGLGLLLVSAPVFGQGPDYDLGGDAATPAATPTPYVRYTPAPSVYTRPIGGGSTASGGQPTVINRTVNRIVYRSGNTRDNEARHMARMAQLTADRALALAQRNTRKITDIDRMIYNEKEQWRRNGSTITLPSPNPSGRGTVIVGTAGIAAGSGANMFTIPEWALGALGLSLLAAIVFFAVRHGRGDQTYHNSFMGGLGRGGQGIRVSGVLSDGGPGQRFLTANFDNSESVVPAAGRLAAQAAATPPQPPVVVNVAAPAAPPAPAQTPLDTNALIMALLAQNRPPAQPNPVPNPVIPAAVAALGQPAQPVQQAPQPIQPQPIVINNNMYGGGAAQNPGNNQGGGGGNNQNPGNNQGGRGQNRPNNGGNGNQGGGNNAPQAGP